MTTQRRAIKLLLTLALATVPLFASGTSAAGAAHSLTGTSWWGVGILCGLVALGVLARKSKLMALFLTTAFLAMASGTSAAGVVCKSAAVCGGGPVPGFAESVIVAVSVVAGYWYMVIFVSL